MGGIKKEAEGWCNSWGSPILRKKEKEPERINTNESAMGVSGKNFKEQGRNICHVLERKGDITFKGSKEQDLLVPLMTKEARSAERMSELHKGWLRAKGWYILKEKRVI